MNSTESGVGTLRVGHNCEGFALRNHSASIHQHITTTRKHRMRNMTTHGTLVLVSVTTLWQHCPSHWVGSSFVPTRKISITSPQMHKISNTNRRRRTQPGNTELSQYCSFTYIHDTVRPLEGAIGSVALWVNDATIVPHLVHCIPHPCEHRQIAHGYTNITIGTLYFGHNTRLYDRHIILCGRRSLVVRTISHVLSLQEHVNLPECRSTRHVPIPTLPHQIKDLFRTVRKATQAHLAPVAVIVVGAVLDHLLVAELVEWLLPRHR